jgi:hypothetical protein
VTNTNDSGPGSLRQAIQISNAIPSNTLWNPGPNFIFFDIGSGAKTIAPLSALPTITSPVEILGGLQPGYAGKPLIQLDGEHVGTSGYGLHIASTGCLVEGLDIYRFFQSEIYLDGGGGNEIQGNYLGTDLTGTRLGGGGSGVSLSGSSGNLIGGTSVVARNVISGNLDDGDGVGVVVSANSDNNTIEGNYIGTNAAGTATLTSGGTPLLKTQGAGVIIGGSNGNTVGGFVPGARNVISGNGIGIDIEDASNNDVVGNLIGTDVTGTHALPNWGVGVWVEGFEATDNAIGIVDDLPNGQVYAAGNVISGNKNVITGGGDGIEIENGVTGTTVQGNKIGTDLTGTKALGNSHDGIFLSDASNNLIGGPLLGDGNVIAANGGNGVEIFASRDYGPNDFGLQAVSIGNQVEGNWIGTDRTGTLHLGNHQNGVLLRSDPAATLASYGNEIGGADTTSSVPWGVGNTIAFNTRDGVSIQGPLMVSNPVRGNSIYGNGGLGIDTQDPPYSYIQLFSADSSTHGVEARLVDNNPSVDTLLVVDFYASAPGDAPAGQVQGRRYLGTEVFSIDPYHPVINVFFTGTFAKGEVISATVTDYWHSITGEFSNPVVAS